MTLTHSSNDSGPLAANLTRARFHGVLLDLDGTLVDTHQFMFNCFTHAVESCLGHTPSRAAWASHAGLPLRDVFRGGVPGCTATEEDLDRLMLAYRTHMNETEHEEVRAYEGIHSTLEILSRHTIRMAIVTTKLRRNAVAHLAAAGLAHHFEGSVTADDCAHLKPHPEPFERGLAILGLPAPAVLAVGDTEHDIRSAQAAGVPAAAACWGTVCRDLMLAARPDFVLETPADLLRLVFAEDDSVVQAVSRLHGRETHR